MSQSKTVESFRHQNPQLANISDDRLVVAIGIKFPQTLKLDSILSNEFSALIVSPASEPENQITTRSQKVYRGVKIIRVDPDGLTISYTNSTSSSSLMSKLQFEDLSEGLQQKYHYDPKSELDYQIKQRKAQIELRQRLITDSKIATESQNKWADEALIQEQIRKQQALDQKLAEAKQREAEAEQKAADAAMIQAMQPPAQINQQQNTFIY